MTSLACESFDKTFSVTHTLVKTGVASGGSVTFGYVIGANFYSGTQQCWKPKCIFQIYIFCFFKCYFSFSVSLLLKLLKMFLLGCENFDITSVTYTVAFKLCICFQITIVSFQENVEDATIIDICYTLK